MEHRNKRGKRRRGLAAVLGVVLLLASGCGKSELLIEGIGKYVGRVPDITVPEEVQIIGLGEATHGNAELQTVKKEVFQTLIEKGECRVFALEGDFGGCLKVNEYIHGGDGTAEEAVAEIGFGLYRTEEMADFAEWLRTYNASVPQEEQVSFYGFDMQRYDNNKEILFSYLGEVDAQAKEELQDALKDMTDDTVYTQSKGANRKAAEMMKIFLEEMQTERERYIAASDEKSYEIAYACGECIMQNATIQTGEVDYNTARDSYMAEKVGTILKLAEDGRVLISGHNGHIQKVSSNASYTCMGELLASAYGEAYYAIGTDFIDGEVNVIGSSGEQTTVDIHLDNALKDQIEKLDGNEFYIDIAKASENPKLAELLDKPLAMVSIGNEFSGWQKISPTFYSTRDVPSDNYDGLILFKTVTPTVRKPV